MWFYTLVIPVLGRLRLRGIATSSKPTWVDSETLCQVTKNRGREDGEKDGEATSGLEISASYRGEPEAEGLCPKGSEP